MSEDYVLALEVSEEHAWVDLALLDFEIEEGGRTFRISSVQTLLSIFVTLDVLRSKTTIYSYSTITPNMLFISTLKHRIGLEKFLRYLKKVLSVLAFIPNKDIERFFASHSDPSLSDLPEPWRSSLQAIKRKPLGDKFLLQRIFEAVLATISYAIPLLSKEEVDLLCQGVKEVMYALAKKSLDPRTQTPALTHNMLVLLESAHYCVHHHIVMQRDFTALAQFRLVFQAVDSTLRFVALRNPVLGKALQEHSFRLLLELLYSADKTQAVGAPSSS